MKVAFENLAIVGIIMDAEYGGSKAWDARTFLGWNSLGSLGVGSRAPGTRSGFS